MNAEAVARRLIVGLGGPLPAPAEEAWLARYRPAGVILFARNVAGPAQLRSLCARLRALLRPEAELVADHEGGPVSVLAAAAGRPPAAWGLGRVDDPDLTRRVHAATARLLSALGIDRVLAPVADVLTEPRNPVIGARAFAADPARAAGHVAAAVQGLREGGLACCLKHWPGHGGAARDSHDGPVDLLGPPAPEPFVAGLQAGAEAVMVGHLRFAAQRGAPLASLDAGAVSRARRLAPGGPAPLIFCDDITMGALASALAAADPAAAAQAAAALRDPAELPLSWLCAVAAAGHDRLLCRGIPWRALPLDGGEGSPPADPAAGVAATADSSAPVAVYEEAWRRQTAVAGGDPFPPGRPDALWFDLTRGDRWGEAAPLASLWRRRLGVCHRPPVGNVRAAVLPGGCSALIVTSHRPLTETALGALAEGWTPQAQGGCLALGHPALPQQLAPVLPAGWKQAHLADLDPLAVACCLHGAAAG